MSLPDGNGSARMWQAESSDLPHDSVVQGCLHLVFDLLCLSWAALVGIVRLSLLAGDGVVGIGHGGDVLLADGNCYY